MEIRVNISDKALLSKENFDKAVLEFAKQAIIAQMARNYICYTKTDAYCANAMLISDMKSNGLVTEKTEIELDKINSDLYID